LPAWSAAGTQRNVRVGGSNTAPGGKLVAENVVVGGLRVGAERTRPRTDRSVTVRFPMVPIATDGKAGAGGVGGESRCARMVLPMPPASRQTTTVSVRVATIAAEPAVVVWASSAPTGSLSRALPSAAIRAAKICLRNIEVPTQFVPSYVSSAGSTCGSPV